MSIQRRTRMNRVMKNKLPYYNVRFVFQTKCKISDFFTFKDKIPSFLHSGYLFVATYYGKTERHFNVRMCEHLGISALTGKRVKGDDDSAIKEHRSFCNHTPDMISREIDSFCCSPFILRVVPLSHEFYI